jgi:two-component system, cell cycle response regulator DivK
MNRRILLIEDNENNRYLVAFLLQAQGWEVVHAPDGPTGLALAATVMPALVLLDIQLPGMDGYAVARALKADPVLAPIPIVAVTSYAMAPDRAAAMAAGCNGYIEKPIDPETFVDTVEQHLRRAAPPR